MKIRFFFSSRRRHTRYWRYWSSDVCSSDLYGLPVLGMLLKISFAYGRLACVAARKFVVVRAYGVGRGQQHARRGVAVGRRTAVVGGYAHGRIGWALGAVAIGLGRISGAVPGLRDRKSTRLNSS